MSCPVIMDNMRIVTHAQGKVQKVSNALLWNLVCSAHSEDINPLCQSTHASWGTSAQPGGESNGHNPQATGDE